MPGSWWERITDSAIHQRHPTFINNQVNAAAMRHCNESLYCISFNVCLIVLCPLLRPETIFQLLPFTSSVWITDVYVRPFIITCSAAAAAMLHNLFFFQQSSISFSSCSICHCSVCAYSAGDTTFAKENWDVAASAGKLKGIFQDLEVSHFAIYKFNNIQIPDA